jgi:hypothetical protein
MPSTTVVVRNDRDVFRPQLLSAQLQLLFANANLGIAVNVAAASILSGLEWTVAPHLQVLAWWLFIVAVATFRFMLTRRFLQASPDALDPEKWCRVFTLAAGLAGTGWGAAGILLYPQGHLENQVFLFFVLGGMMLGASSLLAPMTQAFLAFLVPAGTIPAIRLLLEGDRTHVAMGLLASVFTLATIIGTRRMNRTILASLRLQFENHELVAELRSANQQTAALNQALEQRVQERTAALSHSAEQLRAEIAQRQQT